MSEYLLASEAAHAGAVVLSRAEEATKEEIKATITHLNRALENVRCGRRLDQEIIRKGSLALTDEDFAKLQQCGYVQENYQKMDFTEENSFDTVYVMERQMPVEKILAGMKKSLQIRPVGQSSGSKDLCRRKMAAGLRSMQLAMN